MSKKTYAVLPGVDWVNGDPVPESREVTLSAAEARYDLELGRIQLAENHEPPAEPELTPVDPEPEQPVEPAKPERKSR